MAETKGQLWFKVRDILMTVGWYHISSVYSCRVTLVALAGDNYKISFFCTGQQSMQTDLASHCSWISRDAATFLSIPLSLWFVYYRHTTDMEWSHKDAHVRLFDTFKKTHKLNFSVHTQICCFSVTKHAWVLFLLLLTVIPVISPLSCLSTRPATAGVYLITHLKSC